MERGFCSTREVVANRVTRISNFDDQGGDKPCADHRNEDSGSPAEGRWKKDVAIEEQHRYLSRGYDRKVEDAVNVDVLIDCQLACSCRGGKWAILQGRQYKNDPQVMRLVDRGRRLDNKLDQQYFRWCVEISGHLHRITKISATKYRRRARRSRPSSAPKSL